ncbi:MAG: 4Fe-4S binding protein [Clostridiales bacterium]|jgi:carbon-monoxide dehydrogenase iron sulfur subunit|nr:4Fe-4S binding protein [Clostridiales bacterium]
MKRVYVNEQWCLACHLCEYYCAFANQDETDMSTALKGVPIRPNIRVEQLGDVCFAVNCRHCDEPLCVKGCLTGALSVRDGVISIDRDKCVGCCTCVVSCPYGAVTPTEDGVVQKCELCVNTRDGEPLCVKGCPNAAIVWESVVR